MIEDECTFFRFSRGARHTLIRLNRSSNALDWVAKFYRRILYHARLLVARAFGRNALLTVVSRWPSNG
jgi:hypothetical protein